jgi:hypothetical protein
MAKKKKQFRIKTIKRGFITLYQSEIKTFWGWKAFWCGPEGNWYWHYSPSKDRDWEVRSIENFRLQAGLNENEIEIIKA